MKIYNTLTRSIEEVKTIQPNTVKIYTCGPTVYNYAHIGNLRTYIFEDFLVRAFEFLGYKVVRVMNITDVGHLTSDADVGEDKIEVGSLREGKSAWEIAEFYTQAFFNDFKELNCRMPQHTPKATQHIPHMIEMIKKIEEKGYTYITSDGVYFDTSRFPNYYKLVGKEYVDGIKKGARVEFSKEKRNPTDFALWKFSPKDRKRQMEWDSPWGIGFPGWHIECSAMSIEYLGQPFDIHCGGVDHISIHHTNEIAQAEAANDKPLANYWVHGEFLVLKSSKMSKSSGNFITLSVLKENGISPLQYRYFCSQTHYRKQIEFSNESIEAAKNGYIHLKNSVSEIKAMSKNKSVNTDNSPHLKRFKDAIIDDLNIPKAVSIVWETIRDKNIEPDEKISLIYEFDKVLGFQLLEEETEEIPDEILELVRIRDGFKQQKNYQAADEIRKQIQEKGYILQDTPTGTKVKKRQ